LSAVSAGKLLTIVVDNQIGRKPLAAGEVTQAARLFPRATGRRASHAPALMPAGQVFVEPGLAIKQASPFRKALVIDPARAAYPGGSYEVTNSTVEAGAARCS
jgi:hypothetical protein